MLFAIVHKRKLEIVHKRKLKIVHKRKLKIVHKRKLEIVHKREISPASECEVCRVCMYLGHAAEDGNQAAPSLPPFSDMQAQEKLHL